MPLLALSALVALAFTIEAGIGFGSTVVVLTLGALAMPLERLIALVVPVNLALSALVLARDRDAAELRFLGKQVLPAMLMGMALGTGAVGFADARALKLGYGLFVVALAAMELARRTRAEPSRAATVGWLAAGGVAHGAFAASGPLVVWALGRALPDKRAFRATLAALWLVLNLAWLAAACARDAVDARSLARSATLLPATLLGLALGNALHARLDAPRFRTAVFALMLAAGVVLLGSAALGR